MSLFESIRSFSSGLIDLLYPPTCFACRTTYISEKSFLCYDCKEKLERLQPPFCSRCGAPLNEKNQELNKRCDECRDTKLYYAKGYSVFSYYDERVRNLIFTVKYHYNKSLAQYLSVYIYERYHEKCRHLIFDGIIPVPLHKRRYKEREFNQAELLCYQVSKQIGLPICNDIVIRTKNTKSQTFLNGEARYKNPLGAFSLAKNVDVAQKSFLIVDDVYTTGSTINEVCKVLKEGGASKLYVLTLARAVYP